MPSSSRREAGVPATGHSRLQRSKNSGQQSRLSGAVLEVMLLRIPPSVEDLLSLRSAAAGRPLQAPGLFYLTSVNHLVWFAVQALRSYNGGSELGHRPKFH
jgi:hypothetical protein